MHEAKLYEAFMKLFGIGTGLRLINLPKTKDRWKTDVP